jgi:hypothetical protein
MVVALIALVVAIGGTAAALPGKFTVGRDDLKNSSVGARSLGRMLVGRTWVLKSDDPVADDGIFTETEGKITCPSKAPTAIEPFISGMSQTAFEIKRNAVPNSFGAPLGYRFTVSSDDGPDVGYTMSVNCLFRR